MTDMIRNLDPNILYGAYIALVILLVLNFLWILSRRQYVDQDRLLQMLDGFEARGLGTLFHLFVLGGGLLMALIGWRIPAELAALRNGGTVETVLLPAISDPLIARVAQIVGAFGLGYLALRAMRFIVPVFMTLLAIAIAILASNYLFGAVLP